MEPNLIFEKQYLLSKVSTAGADESGRGPGFGPLCVSILNYCYRLDSINVNDSKKLSAKKRAQLFIELKECDFGVGFASAEEINSLGLTKSLSLAFTRAKDGLNVLPDLYLLDGKHNYTSESNVRCIVSGDKISKTVAGASIIAKVSRDNFILSLPDIYDKYDIKNNKGYLTSKHIAALEKYGKTELHRDKWIQKFI